jgi:hypothetical protein
MRIYDTRKLGKNIDTQNESFNIKNTLKLAYRVFFGFDTLKKTEISAAYERIVTRFVYG